MDLYCVICGEAWDNDCIHEEVSERGGDATYRSVLREFQSKGCNALSTSYGKQECLPTGTDRAVAMSAMFDILGDDADGAAAMMKDLGF